MTGVALRFFRRDSLFLEFCHFCMCITFIIKNTLSYRQAACTQGRIAADNYIKEFKS